MRTRHVPAGILVLALLAAPSALADHVWSHRYFVEGRVLDAAGEPVAGAAVNASLVGLPPGGYCYDQEPAPVTGGSGDFSVCFHTHAVPENASAVVRVANGTWTLPLNETLRVSTFRIQLGNASELKDPGAARLFNVTYHVEGRVLNASGPRNVEGVVVEGDVVAATQVAIVIRYNGNLTKSAVMSTDVFGDYQATIRLDEPLQNGTLTLAAAGQLQQEALNETFMASTVDVVFNGLSPLPPGHPPITNPNPYQTGEAPGSTATPGAGVALVLLAGTLALGLAQARREG